MDKINDLWKKFRRHRYSIPLLLLLTVWLSFFYKLGEAPLFDRDEGAFSEATREMLERNDYISTYLNDEPRYDKPILIYWFQAVSVMVFGVNEFAFRFPSAVFAAFWVLSVYIFTGQFHDKKTAWASAFITATSFWVVVIGRAAIADALLNLFIALSIFDIYRYYRLNKSKYIYRTHWWIGLSVLTKGPIGVIIPVVVSFLFFIIKKDFRRWIVAVLNPIGLLILILLVLPWYGAQYMKEGQAFIDGFFFKHNVNRFLSPMEGHGGALFYYIPVVLLIVLPFSSLTVRIFGRIRNALSDDFDLLLWIWFLFVFVFFSISGTKLPHYVLHGSTALFILLAKYRHLLKSRLLTLLPALILFILLFFLPDIIHITIPRLNDDFVKAILQDSDHLFGLKYRFWMGGALAGILALMFLRSLSNWKSLIVAGLIQVWIMTHLLIPTVGHAQQDAVKEAALLFKDSSEPIVMWGLDNPSFSVYLQKATPWRAPETGELVVTKVTRLNKLKQEYRVLYQKGGIVVAKIEEKMD